MDWQFGKDDQLTKGFKHLHIDVNDVAEENLIRYFPSAIEFIHQGLNYWPQDEAKDQETEAPRRTDDQKQGSGVLIHW
jgi:hypothetical protein